MKSAMRQIKLLLLLPTLGVWGLVAQHFFTPSVASAVPGKRIYVCSSDKEGKLYFDNTRGNIGINATRLVDVLDEAAKRGLKVHSIVSPATLGGYVVFVER